MGLFGGKIDLGETVKKGLSMVDDSSLTAQEKADNTREFVKETLDENTERSKTRRSVAKTVIYNYFGLLWIVIAAFFVDALTAFVINLKALMDIIVQFKVPSAFLAVIAFFFGGYYIQKAIKQRRRDRKKD